MRKENVMPDNFKLIDTKPLADVANNLIDKVSSAVGWYATRETLESIAVNTLINDIQNSNLAPLDKAVLISNAKNILREYTNKSNIVQKAIPLLNEAAKPENVDNDWIAAFMDKVRLISDEEFQIIWAKILAEECNEPRSISKQLLMILAQMDKEDAETFAALCNFCIKVQTKTTKLNHLIIDLTKIDSYYSKYNITFGNLRNLVALGLIDFEEHSDDGYNFTTTEPIISVSYGDGILVLPKTCFSMGGGSVIFKKTGEELFKVINITQHEDFWDEIAKPYLERYWEHEEMQQKLNNTYDKLKETTEKIKNNEK